VITAKAVRRPRKGADHAALPDSSRSIKKDLLVNSTLPGYRAFSRSLSVKLWSDGVLAGDADARCTLLKEEEGDSSKFDEVGESWWPVIGVP
jgi:hypothetical protein